MTVVRTISGSIYIFSDKKMGTEARRNSQCVGFLKKGEKISVNVGSPLEFKVIAGETEYTVKTTKVLSIEIC